MPGVEGNPAVGNVGGAPTTSTAAAPIRPLTGGSPRRGAFTAIALPEEFAGLAGHRRDWRPALFERNGVQCISQTRHSVDKTDPTSRPPSQSGIGLKASETANRERGYPPSKGRIDQVENDRGVNPPPLSLFRGGKIPGNCRFSTAGDPALRRLRFHPFGNGSLQHASN